ncbi:class F sortase [Streptomyces actuosus]|uniref:Class F sortase n=1 Tax=Streptomyces actuosus TaxID=1885 RepID=A0ABS2W0H2_STRAS|nr:class F sortase [Streptomyces actuosus]MBN0048773.1 class F sortase [Streptomyces actuosus]
MRRVGNTALAAVSVTALCTGAWLLHGGAGSHAPPQPSAAERRTDGTHGTHGTDGTQDTNGARRRAAPALPHSPPDRIRIPSIRVDAPLTGLGLTAAGSLDAPPAQKKNLAGWYAAGTAPGERGTAIVAGHVDNTDGPAVFYDLGALRKGAAIEVDRRDGSTAVFTVDAVEAYPASDFPDEKVYGAADRPELRVITCGGGYARSTGYQGNVVVFAHLTGSVR